MYIPIDIVPLLFNTYIYFIIFQSRRCLSSSSIMCAQLAKVQWMNLWTFVILCFKKTAPFFTDSVPRLWHRRSLRVGLVFGGNQAKETGSCGIWRQKSSCTYIHMYINIVDIGFSVWILIYFLPTQNLWLNDVKMREFFLSPVYHKSEKKLAFQTIVKKLNYTELTQNLFGILYSLFLWNSWKRMICSSTAVIADQTRFNKFDSVLKTYMKLMSAHRGEINCEIVTAQVCSVYCILLILFFKHLPIEFLICIQFKTNWPRGIEFRNLYLYRCIMCQYCCKLMSV